MCVFNIFKNTSPKICTHFRLKCANALAFELKILNKMVKSYNLLKFHENIKCLLVFCPDHGHYKAVRHAARRKINN